MIDQVAHVATILLLAPLLHTGWTAPVTAWIALAAGAILATRAGGFAIGLLMQP